MLTGRQHRGAILLCLSVCLCVLDHPRQTHGQQDCLLSTVETSTMVEAFKEKIKGKTWFDTSLYTPTPLNYDKCPKSMLSCFAAEAKVLIKEWNIYTTPVPRTRPKRPALPRMLAILGVMMKVNGTVEAECPQCERYEERSAEKFLDALFDVLHRINSQYCGR